MRRVVPLLVVLVVASASLAHAQEMGSRWHAELGGGYATSLDEAANAPGGGPFIGGFVGRRVSRIVTLGLSLGWHQYVNGAAAPFEAACPPPEAPGPGCVRTRDAKEDALEIAAAIRVEPPSGAWRPYFTATLGAYRFWEDVKYLTYDRAGEELLDTLPTPLDPYAGAGGSLGLGLSYMRGGGPWSVTGSARIHGVMGSPSDDFGSNSWVEFGVGAGVRF